ncbi:MAG: hypothetical protein QMB11_07275 [Nonlabens sp.]|uniref:hypothetical protein n=1 Tax=Nonlabens sp. TaxID=1888209 RepID=UPI0035A58257
MCVKDIFIVSSISYTRSLKPAIHFSLQQKYLESMGFTVVNPIEMHVQKNKMSYTYNCSNNLKKLIDCEWACIMPDVSLKNSSNAELLISLELDMIIIHGDVLEIDVEMTGDEEIICAEIKDESSSN